MIISKGELLQRVHNHHVNAIEIAKATTDILLATDVEGILQFAEQRNLDVFYRFSFLLPSQLLINGDTLTETDNRNTAKRLLDDLCPNIVDLDWYLDDLIAGEAHEDDPDYPGNVVGFTNREKSLCREFIAYNETVDRGLLDRPIGLSLFVILQGKTIGIHEVDHWHENSETIRLSYQALEDILESHREELEEAQRRKQEKRAEAEEWLKSYLVEDNDFFLCSNKQMSERYGEQLWIKPEFRWIHPYFAGKFKSIDPSFFDILERIYKQNKNRR